MAGLSSFANTIDIDSIIIDRENRQRAEIDDLGGLIADISKRGLLNPIIVRRKDKRLIAGERRLTSYKTLAAGWSGEGTNPWQRIPFRYYDELDEADAQIVELSENFHRKELAWRDQALSIYKIHQIRCDQNEDHTQGQTAAELGISESTVSINVAVGEALVEKKFDFSGCAGVQAAYNILKRAAERETDALLADLTFAAAKPAPAPAKPISSTPVAAPQVAASAKTENVPAPGTVGEAVTGRWESGTDYKANAPKSALAPVEDEASRTIIQADFIEWAANYAGQPFNLLHIDFPYGINFGEAKRQNTASDRVAYDDSPDLFWALCRALRDNLDRVVADSAHIMFWFSLGLEPDHANTSYERIVQFFRTPVQDGGCGLVVNHFPLVWCRNGSILPDPNRGPRRGYETALLMTRGDRKIVRPVQNFFEDSTRGDKNIHTSEKPQGMLEYFLGMLVDETSRVLDPTCGSGSAIRAASKFKPAALLGIEQDPEFVKYARDKFRAKNFESELIGDL